MDCAILGYACQTVWGDRPLDFWNALQAGQAPKSYTWEKPALRERLTQTFRDLRSNVTLVNDSRLGVIFASTKGEIDDYIWDAQKFESHEKQDGLTPLLHSFLKSAELNPALSLCVSNACASSLSALFLAQRWIRQGRVDQVLVFATDHIGPFVEKGFKALHAISATVPQPFSASRDGLRLGEATAMVLIGKEKSPIGLKLGAVGIDAEGYAVTRPSVAGESLKRAYHHQTSASLPDLIIAHGTATKINDAAEDQAFFSLFGNQIPITGTKWAIGHTLGASGLLDLIAAAEVIRQQKAFRMGTTSDVDPEFQCQYLTANRKVFGPFKKVLVSSLGFGGIHAIAEIYAEETKS